MEIAVLVPDGVFDSGLAAVLDVLHYANTMADEVPDAPSWHTTVVGLGPEIRTGAGHLVATEPAAHGATADLLVVPPRAARHPAEGLDYLAGEQCPPVPT